MTMHVLKPYVLGAADSSRSEAPYALFRKTDRNFAQFFAGYRGFRRSVKGFAVAHDTLTTIEFDRSTFETDPLIVNESDFGLIDTGSRTILVARARVATTTALDTELFIQFDTAGAAVGNAGISYGLDQFNISGTPSIQASCVWLPLSNSGEYEVQVRYENASSTTLTVDCDVTGFMIG